MIRADLGICWIPGWATKRKKFSLSQITIACRCSIMHLRVLKPHLWQIQMLSWTERPTLSCVLNKQMLCTAWWIPNCHWNNEHNSALTSNKVPGSDLIPTEIYKVGGQPMTEKPSELFYCMWKKETIPHEFKDVEKIHPYMDRVKRIWYLSPMRAAKVQASLRIRAVSPKSPLLAHTSSESRGTFRQKARSLASLNGWACAVKICHDGMLEDTDSLDGAHIW